MVHPELGSAKHIELVEPNLTGQREIIELYDRFNILSDIYNLNVCALEEFESSERFDFVIAEQFLQHIPNRKNAIEKMKSFVADNGIMIMTASDEAGLYVEIMKRAVSHIIIKDIQEYDIQVNTLAGLFAPALKNMKNMTRPVIDWVQDMILAPLELLYDPMNLKDAILLCEDEFDVLGTSQNIFVDLSWYKDSDYNINQCYKNQYDKKLQSFMLAGDDNESIADISVNERLENAIRSANRTALEMEKNNCWDKIEVLIEHVNMVAELTEKDGIKKFNNELIAILKLLIKGNDIDLSQYSNFNGTFGKSSQYISFQKKFKD